MRRIVPYATLTGAPRLALVEPEDWDFTSSLTTPGQASITLNLRELGLTREQARLLVSGWETVYTVETNPAPAFSSAWTVEYAGIVTGWRRNPATGTVILSLHEVAKILPYRPMWGTHGRMDDRYELTGQTLGDLIRGVVLYAVAADRGDSKWPLPVDVGTLRHGSLSRTEWRYHFRSAEVILDELSGEEGAPDWVLRPYRSGDRLRWRLEIGDPYLPGDVIRLPYDALASDTEDQVDDLWIEHDYLSERTGMNVLGAGSEVDMRWGTAGTGQVPEARAEIPALIGVDAYKNIDDLSQLDSLARSGLRTVAGGVEQWSYAVQTGWDDRVRPGDIRPGSVLVIDYPGDELLPPRRVRHYVLSVSSDPSLLYKIESQGVRL